MIDINKNPSSKDLRVFGLLLAIFATLLGSLLFYRWDSPGWARNVWIAGGLLVLLYLAIPRWRRWIYLAWMYLAFPIGWALSHLLLALIYYGILTPVGLLLRIFGYDAMTRKLRPDAESYWIEQNPRREAKSYFRQF